MVADAGFETYDCFWHAHLLFSKMIIRVEMIYGAWAIRFL